VVTKHSYSIATQCKEQQAENAEANIFLLVSFFQLFFKGDFFNVSVASRISYNDFVFVYVFKFPVLVVILSFLFGILHKLHDSQSSVNA
jgi:uncharacterized membrane protein